MRMTAEEDFMDRCILHVSVETDCPQGDDGGRTVIQLSNESGSRWSVEVSSPEGTVQAANPDAITLTGIGDAEALVFARAFTWLGNTLMEMLNHNKAEIARDLAPPQSHF
jgi:hypothetical protein